MHGIPYKLRNIPLPDLNCHFAILCYNIAVNNGACDTDIVQIVKEDDIRTLTRCNAAHFMIHAEAGSRIDRDILDGFDRVEPFLYGTAHDVIHMAVLNQGIGMGVI